MGKKKASASAVMTSNPLMEARAADDGSDDDSTSPISSSGEMESDVAALKQGRRTDQLVAALELTGVDESERTAADTLPEVSFGSSHDRAKNRKRLAALRMDSVLGSGDNMMTQSQAMLRPRTDDVTDVDAVGSDELGNYSPTKSKQLKKDAGRSTVDLEQERYDKMIVAEDWMQKNWIVDPMGTFRKRWDIAQVVLLAYVTAAVPYRIGFDHDTHPWEFFFVLDLFVDVYFLLDIALSFRTAFYNHQGDLEYYPGQIIKHYVSTWFPVDLMGSAPVNYIVLVMELDANSQGYKSNKFFRMMRLFRLLKLLRLLRLNRLLSKYEEAFYGIKSGMKLTKIAGSVFIVGHWLACVWWYFGTSEWIDVEDREFDALSGELILPWTEHVFGPDMHNSTGAGQSRKYVTALYWSFMTMTTVGYGDVHARTTLEKIVSITAMLVGGFVFGLVIGSLSDISRRANPAGKESKKRIGWLTAYLHDRKVSTSLQRSVRRFFTSKYEAVTVFTDNEYQNYFLPLPSKLRLELARQLKYVGDAKGQKGGVLSKVPSMRELDYLSLIAVCSKLKTTYHEKDGYDERAGVDHTYIFKQGEIGYDMMVVMDGVVHLADGERSGSAGPQRISALRFGDYIDEHMALLPPAGYRRRKSCYAFTAATVGLLSAEDIVQLRDERAEIDLHVRPHAQAAKRARYQKRIDAVFKALDQDGDGWIEMDEFASVVKNRKPKSKGGNEAEAFFDQILRDSEVTEQLIADTYNEIFLQTLDMRQSRAIFEEFERKTKPRHKRPLPNVLVDEGAAKTVNSSAAIDKSSFEAWWLTDVEEDDYDKLLEKKRVKARLDHIVGRADSMKLQMDRIEDMVTQLK